MAFKYIVDVDLGTVFSIHTGQIDLHEMSSLFQTVLDEPDFSPGMNFYRDTRGATFPDQWNFSFFNQQTSLKIHKTLTNIGECKLAWVVDGGRQYSTAHQVGLRNYLNQSDLIERKSFTNPLVARKWLGLPENIEISFPDTT